MSQNNGLRDLIVANEIQVGDAASYNVCKTIFTLHPLGMKLASHPVHSALSIGRRIAISNAPEAVVTKFEKTFSKLGLLRKIKELLILSRVYGVASLVVGQEHVDLSEAIDITNIAKYPLFFNVIDPIISAGSLATTLDPLSPHYLVSDSLRVNGKAIHKSRCFVKNNGEEQAVHLNWSQSAFGFCGRSVYQRSLIYLKMYLKLIQTDEYVLDKAGAIIAKVEVGGSIYDKASSAMTEAYRNMINSLRGAKVDTVSGDISGGVLTIGHEDDVQAIQLLHVNETIEGVKNRILCGIAASDNMPSSIMKDDALATGHADGSEDKSKEIEYYIRIQEDASEVIDWLDAFAMRLAWDDDFLNEIKATYSQYESLDNNSLFYLFKNNFSWTFNNLKPEPHEIVLKNQETMINNARNVIRTLQSSTDDDSMQSVLDWYVSYINSNLDIALLPDSLIYENNAELYKNDTDVEGE